MKYLLVMAGICAIAFASPPTLEQVLPQIHQHVGVFENQLPDFVCDETITSRTISDADGKIEKEAVIVSAFTGRQKHGRSLKLVNLSFSEERQIKTVNGAPWTDKNMPKGVFLFGGGYSSSLVRVFGSRAEEHYRYELQPGSGSAFVIAFESTDDSHKAKSRAGVESFRENGHATFDANSLDIVRLESIITGHDGHELPLLIDFAPVRIGEATFQMPSKVKASARHQAMGKSESGEYEAVYSNYRKYGSSSSIQYEDSAK